MKFVLNINNLVDIVSNQPREHLLRVFLLSLKSKNEFNVIRNLIDKKKGTYFLGEFLVVVVESNTIKIIDDFDLELGVEKISISSNEAEKLIEDWELFLKKHNKLK